MTAYSAAVIGCGFMGSLFNETPSYDPHHTHAGSYHAHEKINLLGVCDPDVDRVTEAAAFWGVEAYNTPEAMLDEVKPEIVSIASPTSTHAEVLGMALETKSVKAILCEKPITTDNEVSKELADLAKKKDVIIGVNYSRRYNAGFQKVKELIERDGLGSIQTVSVLYQNGILNNGSHFIDLLRYFFGEIAAVNAKWDEDACYESDLSGWLEFKNGMVAHMHGVSSNGAALAEIDIIGTNGRIRTEQGGHSILKYDLEPSTTFPGYNDFISSQNISEGLIDNTYNAIQDLIDCIEKRIDKPRSDAQDAIEALNIVNSMIQSAKENKKIQVKRQ